MFFIFFITQSEMDDDKFEFIYTRYKNLLLYKAWEILKDYALAEDAVSEAFMRIYKNLHKIDDAESGKCVAFIVTIARNVSLTALSKVKAAEPVDENQADEIDLAEDVVSRLSSQRIYDLLNEIDEVSRNIFLYKYAYDLSHKEIAQLTKLSENNVTVKLHRARKKLAQILTKEGYGHGGE